MITSSKLKRIKDRENEKIEKEKCFLRLKQSALPPIESQTSGRFSKCNNCNKERSSYGLTYEWSLEPLNILKFNNLSSTMLSCLMSALIVHPAQMKIIKFLEEQTREYSIIFVLQPENSQITKTLVDFALKHFKLKTTVSIEGKSEDEITKLLDSKASIFVSQSSHLDTLMEMTKFGKSQKVYWLPVSIGYENFYEFSMLNFIRKFATYGRVKLAFHAPYTYDDFFQTKIPNAKLLRNHLYYDIVFKAPVMATNLVAFLLLTYFKDGGSLEQFVEKVETLQKELRAIDLAFEGETLDVVEYALDCLDDQTFIDNAGIIKPKCDALERLKDSAKTILFHFSLKSVLLSYLNHVDYDKVDFNKMIEYALDVCHNLKIPFKECSTMEDQIIEAFDKLKIKGLFVRQIKIYTENEIRAQKMAQYYDDDDDDDDDYEDYEKEEFDPDNQVIINIDMQEDINVLKDIIQLIQESGVVASNE